MFFSLILLILAPLASSGGPAQDDPAQDMRDWSRRQRDAFDNYVSEQDREFAAFLSEAWREFDVAAGRVRDVTPKPHEVPRAPEPVTPPPPIADRPDVTPIMPLPDIAPPPPPPSARPGTSDLDLSFLGLVYRLPVDRELGDLSRGQAGPDDAGRAWLAMSQTDSNPLVTAINQYVDERHLGDWGQFKLIESLAYELYPVDPSRRALLHWHLAVRTGLDVRLAYGRPGYVVCYATETAVFQIHFLMHQKTAYYIHDPSDRFAESEKLRTYEGQGPGNLHPLRFDLAELPLTEPDPVLRTLCWELNGQQRETEVVTDRWLVTFLGSVPQTNLDSHFGSSLSPAALHSIAQSLAPDLESREPNAQVGVLLHFVQTAFPYSTDLDQFGYEDYLYPDESLFHPACDCEDRAVLFAVLVRELVGLEVVGLDYPGHIAAAVALPEDVPGDRFTYQDVRYTVCDPTYIGAGLGRSMPIAGSDRPGIIAVTG